jgi:acetylornithine/succinyldiaminopimelate/putrescine aminotransferase
MKNLYLAAFLFVLGTGFVSLNAAQPEQAEFPGVEKAMKPSDYEAAGLQKLDPAERAKLDDFIRHYVAVSNEKVATEAVDKAVKSNKVSAPEIIQSRIVGPFTGYNGRTIFTLENGQRWAQSQGDSAYYPKIDSPPVIIVKAGFGYRMHIAGGGAIRVSLIR